MLYDKNKLMEDAVWLMCSNEQVTSLAEMCTSASTSSAVAKTHPDYGQQQGMADDRAVEGCGAPNIH
jgi:hypothetical protein